MSYCQTAVPFHYSTNLVSKNSIHREKRNENLGKLCFYIYWFNSNYLYKLVEVLEVKKVKKLKKIG